MTSLYLPNGTSINSLKAPWAYCFAYSRCKIRSMICADNLTPKWHIMSWPSPWEKAATQLCHHNPHVNGELKLWDHSYATLCHLNNIIKETNTKKIPANMLQTLLRKATRPDLISFLFRKRKCDKPKHGGKSAYYLTTQDRQNVSSSVVTRKSQINKKSWWGSKVTRKKSSILALCILRNGIVLKYNNRFTIIHKVCVTRACLIKTLTCSVL